MLGDFNIGVLACIYKIVMVSMSSSNSYQYHVKQNATRTTYLKSCHFLSILLLAGNLSFSCAFVSEHARHGHGYRRYNHVHSNDFIKHGSDNTGQAEAASISTSPLLAKKNDEDEVKADIYKSLQDKFNYEGRLLEPDDSHRCGFVSLIGAANMGKSTLLNALLQEELCSTTHRPQTTRHSILGVLSSDEQACQLCFTDTPGVIEDPAYKLQEGMMEAVKGAFHSSDVILIVTDLFSTPIPDDILFERISTCKKKKIVVINKIDLADKVTVKPDDVQQYHNLGDHLVEDVEDDQQLYKRTVSVAEAVRNWRQLVPDALAIMPMIASEGGDNVGVTALRTLLTGGPDVPKAFRDMGRPLEGMFQPGVKFIDNEEAMQIIPSGPPLYDYDTLTDRTER